VELIGSLYLFHVEQRGARVLTVLRAS
jgi:hypothetical protein